jgi:hypothetical protein
MPYYPKLAQMQLVDYKVRVLDNGAGTGARVRVLIESTDGSRRWGTVGVSANVVEASWQALLDSVDFKLHKDQVKARKPAASVLHYPGANGAVNSAGGLDTRHKESKTAATNGRKPAAKASKSRSQAGTRIE